MDDYGSVWVGAPGEKGSTVVGDVVWGEDDLGDYPLHWLEADARRTVR